MAPPNGTAGAEEVSESGTDGMETEFAGSPVEPVDLEENPEDIMIMMVRLNKKTGKGTVGLTNAPQLGDGLTLIKAAIDMVFGLTADTFSQQIAQLQAQLQAKVHPRFIQPEIVRVPSDRKRSVKKYDV